MSRINEALKRAQRAQKKNPPSPVIKRPGLLPVKSRPGNVIGWILPGMIGFLIVAASFFIGMALVTRTVTKGADKPGLSAVKPANPAPISTPTAPPPALPPSSQLPPPPPPEPKLQGIVYTETRPWAIVDGQTVHVGDRLGEFRVKEISQHNVKLEKADGSQKKLGLDK